MQQWVCSRYGTRSPPLGSSTKCLRIVTLQSSCERHWLHTCCNLTQTQSQAEGMCLRVTRGMDTLACLFLCWRNLPQLTGLLLWPWSGWISKGTRQCCCEGMTVPILSQKNRFYSSERNSVSFTSWRRFTWLFGIKPWEMKGFCSHLPLYPHSVLHLSSLLPSLNPSLAVWAFSWFWTGLCMQISAWKTHIDTHTRSQWESD